MWEFKDSEPLAVVVGLLLPSKQSNETMNLAKSLYRHFNPHSLTYSWQVIAHEHAKLYLSRLRTALPKTCLLVALLLSMVNLMAQNSSETPSFRERADFKLGYFGNLQSNHGLNLGTEYLWLEKVKLKEKRNRQKTIKWQLLLNGNLGYSTNFATRTQNGIFAYSGLIFRRVNSKSWELSVELNPLGAYRSVLSNTYKVVGDDVTSVSFPGRTYYAPSVAIGTGHFRKEKKRSGWYLNLQYTLLTNYNTGELPIVSLNFGCKLNFSKK